MPIIIKYGTPKVVQQILRFKDSFKYKILRPFISFAIYYTYGIFVHNNHKISKSGKTLKNGICAAIPIKDEEFAIYYCLESLIGFADQIICIDNGSTDNTVSEIKRFITNHSDNIHVILEEMPTALLVDIRQRAHELCEYNWILKWDGDNICTEEIKELRKKVLKLKRPSAFSIKRANLHGDLKHVQKMNPVVDNGEYFLQSFTVKQQFKEYNGRLEHAKIPIYYKMWDLKKVYVFHLSGVKSIERNIFRHCYLDWREISNKYSDRKIPFETFKQKWIAHNFETTSNQAFKYRAARLEASYCVPYNESEFLKYPVVLKNEMEKTTPRFSINYKNNEPYIRIDAADEEMLSYQPSPEDLDWKPDYHKFYNDSKRLNFKV